MQTIWPWLVSHQIFIYYGIAVLIEQLPEPAPNGNPVYKYFYSVIQIFAANWKRSGTSFVKKPATPPQP